MWQVVPVCSDTLEMWKEMQEKYPVDMPTREESVEDQVVQLVRFLMCQAGVPDSQNPAIEKIEVSVDALRITCVGRTITLKTQVVSTEFAPGFTADDFTGHDSYYNEDGTINDAI